MTERTFTVFGNHGLITVDAESGAVLELDTSGAENPGEYAGIVRFDVDEWRKFYPGEALENDVDILDLGYWFKTEAGRLDYEAPCEDWRERHEEAKEG